MTASNRPGVGAMPSDIGRRTAMTTIRMLALCLLACIGAAPAAAQGAGDADARSYPNRTVRVVVPFPPGGPADLIARFVGQKMSEDFGQPFVIENRAGGNTAIGAQAVARAAPDGYPRFLPMGTTLAMSPLAVSNPPYDPPTDCALVSLHTQHMSLLLSPAPPAHPS